MLIIIVIDNFCFGVGGGGFEFLGTGGQEDMKRICGITVAEEKDKVGKADKVISIFFIFYFSHHVPIFLGF